MTDFDELLKRIASEADARGVYLRRPLSERKLSKAANKIRDELGIEVPQDYLRLLRFTDGMQTQRGALASLEEISEQNTDIWFMETKAGPNAQGEFEIRYEPLDVPRTPTYLWLGYDGNSAEQVFDLATGEFHQRALGGTGEPQNRDRTLAGLLKHLIFRE